MKRELYARFTNGFEVDLTDVFGENMVEINEKALEIERKLLREARRQYRECNEMLFGERTPPCEILYRKISGDK